MHRDLALRPFILISAFFFVHVNANIDTPDRREPPKRPQVDLEVTRASGHDVHALCNEHVALPSRAVRAWSARRDRPACCENAVPWNWRVRVRVEELQRCKTK